MTKFVRKLRQEKTFHWAINLLWLYGVKSHKLQLRDHLFTQFCKHWVIQVHVLCTSTSCQPALCAGHDPLPCRTFKGSLPRTYMRQLLWRTCCMWDSTVAVVGMILRQHHPFPVSGSHCGSSRTILHPFLLDPILFPLSLLFFSFMGVSIGWGLQPMDLFTYVGGLPNQ